MRLEETPSPHRFRPAAFRRPRSCDFCKRMLREEGSLCPDCRYCCHWDCRPKVIAPCRCPSVSSLISSSSDESRSLGHWPEMGPAAMEVAYLTDRIVLLWFPETGSNTVHASDLREVARILHTRHGGNYMVFNLSQRKNDLTQFGAQVLEFGWPPGLAPPLQRLCSICKAVDTWLISDPDSVVVLHSKGDRGRLGAVVSAYLRYTAICSPSDTSVDRPACQRFFGEKLQPYMSPCQQRYVGYLAGLLSGSIQINNGCVYLQRLVVHGVPGFESGGGYRPFFKIYQGMQHIYTTATFWVSASARQTVVELEPCLQLHGDVLIKCYHSSAPPAGRSVVFRLQFHTCTLDKDRLLFGKEELDEADNDFRFPSEGKVELRFCPPPAVLGAETRNLPGTRDPLASWDSYEDLEGPPERQPIIKKEIQLDRLLDDMIRDIHSISEAGRDRPLWPAGRNPDYGRPSPSSGRQAPTAVISVNGNRQVLSPTGRPAEGEEDKPYHARKNCAPFSYGVTPGSPVLQRKFLRPASPVSTVDSRIEAAEDGPEESGWEDPNSRMWLQKQRDKLKARKEGKVWEDRQLREQRLMDELRSAHHRKSPEPPFFGQTTGLSTPLHVIVSNGPASSSSSPCHTTAKPPICRGSSAPSSPQLPSRGSSREVTRNRYQQWQSGSPLTRQKSDTSCDRERPFASVKKAHQQAREQATPPHRIIGSSLIYADRNWPDSDLSPCWAEEPASVSPTSSKLDELEQSLQALTTDSPAGSPVSGPASPVPRAHSTPLKAASGEPAAATPPASPSTADRPATPSFPVHPGTPYFEHESPAGSGRPPRSPSLPRKEVGVQSLHQSLPNVSVSAGGPGSPASDSARLQRSSLLSLTEPVEVVHHHPLFVKDTSKFWYKPDISREEAIAALKDKPPGTFVVRDSNSFPGAFGLALKVAVPPPNAHSGSGDPSSELVRHFLIEPTSGGVRLKGCANEPVFGSLSALVYQHSMTPLALPCRLILPETDPAGREDWPSSGTDSSVLARGAACNLLYLGAEEVESLTGSAAVERALTRLLEKKPARADVVHFKVSGQGITLTDNSRRLFFRRHYPLASVSYCGLDPRDRRWSQRDPQEAPDLVSSRCFGFVAKKTAGRGDNQCHLLAELEKEQPASAVLDFVRKVMNEAGSNKTDPV